MQDLIQASVNLRVLFFFIHDLDEQYELGDEQVRQVVDRYFQRRYNMDLSESSQGLVPLLQATTLICSLFPFIAAARSPSVQKELVGLAGDQFLQRWDAEITSPRASSVQLVVDLTRHSIAHLFDDAVDRSERTDVDFDSRSFTCRAGNVTFLSTGGLAAFASDVISAVSREARRALIERQNPPDGKEE